ncbi:MAG TPA: glutamate--tRNA ligase [Steroidobacteraceae bacterium]|nr:glutamate--tRNA ligase [Steroidobacteraceae bacterium]
MEPTVTRFAPSPSGALHPGNARTALFSFLLARRSGGRFLLRVEDSDRERSGEEFVAGQLADLSWLGLGWDGGPDHDDGRGPYRQSERGAIYARLFAQLEAAGQAYPCYCAPAELDATRRAQLARGEPPRYPGTCRGLDAGARAARAAQGLRPALRLALPERQVVRFDDLVRGPQETDAAALGDFVIRRADGAAVFFFCNAADDALMGVTHVLRGDDHLSNTPRQLLLLAALGLAAPRYGHLPLLLDAGGAPQSKRRGSITVGELRGRGYLPGAVANYLLRLGHHGAPDAWVEPAELARHFDPGKLGRAPAHFDLVQLDHWQREAVRRLSPSQAAEWLAPALPSDWPSARRVETARLLQGNLLLPGEAAGWVAVLSGELAPLTGEDAAAVAAAGAGFFESALAAFDDTGGDLARLAEQIRARTGRKGREIYRPLRIALTGRHDGPELAALLPAIPPALVRERLANAARMH